MGGIRSDAEKTQRVTTPCVPCVLMDERGLLLVPGVPQQSRAHSTGRKKPDTCRVDPWRAKWGLDPLRFLSAICVAVLCWR